MQALVTLEAHELLAIYVPLNHSHGMGGYGFLRLLWGAEPLT